MILFKIDLKEEKNEFTSGLNFLISTEIKGSFANHYKIHTIQENIHLFRTIGIRGVNYVLKHMG